MEPGWVLIYTVGKPYQADMAKEILEEYGIHAIVINKRDSAYLSFGDMEVYVHEEDAVRGREILEKSGI